MNVEKNITKYAQQKGKWSKFREIVWKNENFIWKVKQVKGTTRNQKKQYNELDKHEEIWSRVS